MADNTVSPVEVGPLKNKSSGSGFEVLVCRFFKRCTGCSFCCVGILGLVRSTNRTDEL